MKFDINKLEIGGGRTFIIAEIGNNHNGSIDRAVNMVDLAKEAGADCVKFQMRHIDQVYRARSLDKSGEDLGTEYIIDLLNRFELTVDDHRRLAKYSAQIGIPYLCTPWDSKSIDILESFSVPAYKVSSADLTNLPLIDYLIQTKKPLILSTGMNTKEEVEITTAFLNRRGARFCLLHCNSTYPAPLHDINLKWMTSLREIHPLVGYSGHERGINVSVAAAALDACVIERHFTLDRQMEGPDHAASLTPEEFGRMVRGIREVELALGQGDVRVLSQGEMINRENLGKSLVAAKALEKGTFLTAEHIKVRSPGQGLSPQAFEQLIGRNIKRAMAEEDFFYPNDLKDNCVEPKDYRFNRPWGVPVRFHDFEQYASRINPDVWEFHLSYADMNLNPEKFLKSTYDGQLIVHAPELFSDSHLMDLANPDDQYRRLSIIETQRVIDITRDLQKYFPRSDRPLIVANIGGFSMDEPIPDENIRTYYERFAKSLKELDMAGVEIIPQTMAPFPWHFGGQRYQNLFVKIDEIIEWCTRLKMKMCFDISHTKLACNHLGVDFYEYAERLAPLTAHIHMGDASGVNGEGLQINEGEIDFKRLGIILNRACPNASFIPEIWQGHKNNGEGFWIALQKLEELI